MPGAEEMDGYNDLFTSIEEYDGMTVDYLAVSFHSNASQP